jgi:nondiscriminating glutamyl-tRNA synthetase
MTIRTRFAPSPTGYLHIGGVRTALFNWLLSRRQGGQFILRIDDTDAERNRPEALQPIIDGFRWLGISWDEGPEIGGPHAPYFQSQRGDKYRAAALKLIESGDAYPDYMTKEQLDAARHDQAMAEFTRKNPTAGPKEIEAELKAIKDGKRPFIFRGPERNQDPASNVRQYREKPTTVRLKVPAGRAVVIDDMICGKVEVRTDQIGDPVILRADGRAIYNFATVVDDVDLKITHIVRAREHLSNTPVQVLVYEALNYPMPRFAHVPVVNRPNSSKKLSKREMKDFMTAEVIAKLRAAHAVPADATDEQIKNREDVNPATVAFYREMGYLPASLVNYFGRLGWSLDDKTEIIPLDMMIANFSLERVNDSPASFDPEKLLWLAGEYMRMLPLEEKVAGVLPFLQRAGLVGATVDEAVRGKIRQVMEACGDRIKIFADIFQYGAFFFRDPNYDAKAVDKRLRQGRAPEVLAALVELLPQIEPFEAAVLEERIKKYCEEQGIKIGDMNHILRVATTGVTIGPGVFECLAIFGRAETLRRMELARKLV